MKTTTCPVGLGRDGGAMRRAIGDQGAVIGLEQVGPSAPGPVVMHEYGFSAENVDQLAMVLLERKQT